MKITKKSHVAVLTAFGFIIYFTSYLTRVGFNTMMVDIALVEGYAESHLSVAITACFFTYGIGQLISGFLGDRFNPTRIIALGLSVSTVVNLSIPFAPNPTVMALLWGLNGLSQAFVYPPLIKTMSVYMTAEQYPNSIMVVAIAGNIGTLAVSLLSPLIISISSWKTAFFCFGGFAVAVIALWLIYSTHLGKQYGPAVVHKAPEAGVTGSSGIWKPALACGIVFIMISIFAQGFIKDGVTTWMAPYIADVFEKSSEESILSTFLFPVLSAAGVFLTTFLKKKVIRNELLLSIMYFSAFLVCLGLLCLLRGSYIASVILLTLMIMVMTSANFAAITFVPVHFAKYGRISLMAGVLNSCTFIGSAISAYGLGLVRENLGWWAVFVAWATLAAVGILVTLSVLGRFSKLRD